LISETIKIAIIAAVPPSLAAIAAVVLGVLNHSKLSRIHISINGRLNELMTSNSRLAHLEGRESMRQEMFAQRIQISEGSK
jgi:hypothetical protein